MARLAPGASVLAHFWGKGFSLRSYQLLALILTFIAYTLYHAARKPPSIVKSSLDPEKDLSLYPKNGIILNGTFTEAKGWPPFNSEDGKGLLGNLDVAFLGAYAAGMFVAGHIGDRVDLRLFLTLGMTLSGFFTVLFGMGYIWNIHSLSYFLLVQMLAGAFQSTGWPSVISVVANWHGKKRLGFIMGCWNAHVSVGNILGSLIAASVLHIGWGYSFIIPGALLMGGGLLMYLLLIVHPEDVGMHLPDSDAPESNLDSEGEASNLLQETETRQAIAHSDMKGISFWEAWKIPGVAPFAFCLFFTKLVAYCLMYWLPFYIRHTDIGGQYLSDAASGRLSTLFDIGGVAGGILAGTVSDHFTAPASTAACFMYLAIPCLWVYFLFGHVSLFLNVLLMIIAGVFVNGPYALITTAVSADLGRKGSVNNSRATAIVTAIIDGSGSLGAAIGPLLTGWISQAGGGKGWRYVFYMLMLSALAAALLLSKLVLEESRERRTLKRTVEPQEGDPLES